MHYSNDLYNHWLSFLNRNFLFMVPIGEFSKMKDTHLLWKILLAKIKPCKIR